MVMREIPDFYGRRVGEILIDRRTGDAYTVYQKTFRKNQTVRKGIEEWEWVLTLVKVVNATDPNKWLLFDIGKQDGHFGSCSAILAETRFLL